MGRHERERRFYEAPRRASSGNARYAKVYEGTSDEYETGSDSERTSYGHHRVPPSPRRRQNEQPSFDERGNSDCSSLRDLVEWLSTHFSEADLHTLGARLVLSACEPGSTLYTKGPNSDIFEEIYSEVGDDATSGRGGASGLYDRPPSNGHVMADDETFAHEDVYPEMKPGPMPEWALRVPRYNGGCMYYPSNSYTADQLKMMLEGRVKLRNGLVPIAGPDGEGCDCALRWVTNESLRRLTNRRSICDVSGKSLPRIVWRRALLTFHRE